MFDGLSVPKRKFVADACYELLKSGSPLGSEPARAERSSEAARPP